MNSLEIREFKTTISAFCAQSNVPFEVQRMCLAEILREVEEKSNKEIMEQLNAREKVAKKRKGNSHAESV